MKLYFNQLQPNISWKAYSNNNVTIVPKNIKNEIPDNININEPWPEDCAVKKYKFNANPIRHYRKQYTNVDSKANTFSNLSFIGTMDKPGGNIVTQNLIQNNSNNSNFCNDPKNNINSSSLTYIQNNDFDCNTLTSDKFYDASSNKIICTSLHPSALVIKTATTKLATNYSSSYRELLYKNKKTFTQNLPLNNNSTTTMIINCNEKTSCNIFNPSNKKYQTQGPITSSARIASLKYECEECPKVKATNSKCPPNMPLNECDELTKILKAPFCFGCINDKTNIRRKRINILK
jgi:hypothetical protein